MWEVSGVSINIDGAGDHVVVEGEAGKWIKVFRLVLTCQTEQTSGVDLVFKSGSVEQPGPLHLYDGGSITLDLNRRRWVETEIGDDLVISLSDAATIKGALTIQVGP